MSFRPLFGYQQDAVDKFNSAGKLLISSPTGSGKSRIALECARAAGGPVLIVCPAMVKSVWAEQIAEWAPELSYYVWKKPTPLKRDKPNDAQVWIVNYEILAKIPARAPKLLILDESHFLANEQAKRTASVKAMIESFKCAVLGLSATPLTNRPASLWAQLDTIWPGKMPNYYNFVRTYCEVSQNEWSKFVIGGFKPGGADRLRNALRGLLYTVSPDDVAVAYGGRFSVEMHQVRQVGPTTQRSIFAEHTSRGAYAATFVAADGRKPCILLCKYRATAKDAARHCKDSVLVTGELATDARMAAIEMALAEGRHVVATYQSVLEGINILTAFRHAIYLELPTTPREALQSLGRFNRANGQCPVTLLVQPGTVEEEYAKRLQEKLADAQGVVGTTETGAKLSGALDIDGDKELARLAERLKEYEPEDSYY